MSFLMIVHSWESTETLDNVQYYMYTLKKLINWIYMLITLSFDSLENCYYIEFIAILFCPWNHEVSNGCCKVQLTSSCVLQHTLHPCHPTVPRTWPNEKQFLYLWWKPDWYKGLCSLGLVPKKDQGATAVYAETSNSKALLHISL